MKLPNNKRKHQELMNEVMTNEIETLLLTVPRNHNKNYYRYVLSDLCKYSFGDFMFATCCYLSDDGKKYDGMDTLNCLRFLSIFYRNLFSDYLNSPNQTVLHDACHAGHFEVVKLFSEFILPNNFDI